MRGAYASHVPLLLQWSMCEVACPATSCACIRERRRADALALDTDHDHHGRAALGRMGSISRKELGSLLHSSIMSNVWEDRSGRGSGLSSCVLLARQTGSLMGKPFPFVTLS